MIDRHTIPPKGWIFREPSTGWTTPTPISSTFDQVVQQIIAMRKKNPAITAKLKLATDKEAVGAELERYTRKRLGLPEGGTPVPFPVSHRYPNAAVAGAVGAVKKLASGAALLLEWEQDGAKPVAKELAEKRAAICAVCPKNEKGATLSEWFTIPAANLIRKQFERLNQMNLSTSKDAELQVCSACLCPLRLKVHVPLALALKRIKPEMKADLDPKCWIINER